MSICFVCELPCSYDKSEHLPVCPSCDEIDYQLQGTRIDPYLREFWKANGGNGWGRSEYWDKRAEKVRELLCPQCKKHHP